MDSITENLIIWRIDFENNNLDIHWMSESESGSYSLLHDSSTGVIKGRTLKDNNLDKSFLKRLMSIIIDRIQIVE